MCGIAGAVGNGATQESLRAQLRVLEHRGPDATGIYLAGPAAVGQTRLAVIDLVTGHPPVTDEGCAIGAVLNGEIYNYRELRQDLARTGHTLRTQGDTEVIPHLAETLEPVELARRLDGMFAFAYWDSRRSRLVLGRDRLGKKPLYYFSGATTFVFASEIKALLAHPAVPRRLAREVLPAYLAFGYAPTPQTFYEGIFSLPPGHVAIVEPGSPPRVLPYWQPPGRDRPEPLSCSFADAAALVRSALVAAVERRLVADVPVGAFLSGGVDSSAIVACMAELMDRPVATFTIGFDDKDGFDERPYAQRVATRFRTDHTEFVVVPHAASMIERLVDHHDQPFGDSSSLPTYLLSQLTRKHVTVALCGDGGDELFAGYERFAAAVALARLRLVPALLRNGLRRSVGVLPPGLFDGRAGSVQRFLALAGAPPQDALRSWVSFVPDRWRAALLPRASSHDGAERSYGEAWDVTAGWGLLDRLLLVNLRTYLLDDLLPKVDRMSMAHALEVRSPFLDAELVDLAFRLPASTKLRGIAGKRVLKAAMSDVLPREVLQRRKHGFGLPLDRWFRDDLRPMLEATIASPRAALRAHLDPAAVDQIVAEHLSGAASHGHALWTLMTLELFLRREGW